MIKDWDRSRIANETVNAYRSLSQATANLTVAELDAPTRCAGWRVENVLAHLLATAEDVLDGTIGQRDPDTQAQAYPDASPDFYSGRFADVADRIGTHLNGIDDSVWNAETFGVPGQPFGYGVLTLIHEIAVHGDDIDVATGRSQLASDEALAISAEWLMTEFDRLGDPNLRVTLNTGETLISADSGDAVIQIKSDRIDFIRAATGRLAPEKIGAPENLNIYARDRLHSGV